MTGFEHRGVVEGFYGPPYRPADRLWLVERLGRAGMNRYVHAPKNDPLHRERWREPYAREALVEFEALVGHGASLGVEVGFAVSPGLSMEYASETDRTALATKLAGFRQLGARFFGLFLDDVPSQLIHPADREAFASLAEAHASVAHELAESLGDDCRLWLVPTDYTGTGPTGYLETLGEKLDPRIEVGWTGRTLVSPEIRVAEARQRAETLGRRLLVWDNVPVADGPMRPLLHLGPYRGRDAGLAKHVSGFLLNPMQHPRASWVALATAAAFLSDPDGYDPERAWTAVLDELGGAAAGALRLFAEAHRFSPLAPQERDRALEAAFARLRAAAPTSDAAAAARRELAALLAERESVAETLRETLPDRALAAELEPWLESHAVETRRMARALALLDVLAEGGDRFRQVIDFLGFEAGRNEPPPRAVSYGPRRALYPQLASLRQEDAGFGPDPALFLDCCLAEEIAGFAEVEAVRLLGASIHRP